MDRERFREAWSVRKDRIGGETSVERIGELFWVVIDKNR